MEPGKSTVECNVKIVFRFRTRLTRASGNYRRSINEAAENIQALVEKAISTMLGNALEVVSVDLQFRNNQRSVSGGSKTPLAALGTKKSAILELLGRDGGVTNKALREATGWKSNTVSAQLDYLSKTGFAIDRIRKDGLVHYRLVEHVSEKTDSHLLGRAAQCPE